MNPNMVSFSQYEGIAGFGAGPAFTAEQLEEMNKSLVAGNDIINPGAAPGVGFPLRVESLEKTLKNVTFRAEHLRLFKMIPKIPAYNTVEEHNEISSYGEAEEAWIAENQLPNESDSTYARKYAIVKFLGITRSVSHVMSIVRPAHGDVVANSTIEGTMHLLKMLERGMFYGRSDLSPLQFDGFAKLIGDGSPAANIIDMRGQPLSEDKLSDAALTIQDAPNFGTPTHLHLNPKVKADLVKAFYPKGRYDIGDGTGRDMIGLDVKGVTTPAGDVMFESNVFITDGGGPAAAQGDPAQRPAAPSITTNPTTPTDAASLFGATDAGSYFYFLTAHNDFGHSDPIAVSGAAIAVTAGEKTTFGVTPAAGPATRWFQLYRSAKNGLASATRLIARIPNPGSAELIVNDYNTKLPFTSDAFMWQQNMECMSFKQLAPMIKIPLATIGPSIRWMQLIYGVPVLYAPGRAVLFRNVGRSPNYVGQP